MRIRHTRTSRSALLAVLALCAGLTAAERPTVPPERLAAIDFSDSRNDNWYVLAVAKDLSHLGEEMGSRFAAWTAVLEGWPPAMTQDPQERTAALLDLIALVDLSRHHFEREAPRHVFDRLREELPKDVLVQCCARFMEDLDRCAPIAIAPELGLPDQKDPQEVRQRARQYAKKLLGRLLGELPD